jgi:Na+-driven multidrug efflux pump
MYNIAQVLILFFINQISPEAVIAQSYIMLILSYVFIFSFALASGNSIIVGYYIGEKEHEVAFKHTFKTTKAAFIIIIIITGLLNLLAYPLIGLFTDNVIITEMVRKVLFIAIFIEIGRAMNMIFIAALRSAGDTIFPVIMAVISMFGLAVLFTYILAIKLELGIIGVFIALSMDEIFRGMSMVFRWYQRKWMKVELIEVS